MTLSRERNEKKGGGGRGTRGLARTLERETKFKKKLG